MKKLTSILLIAVMLCTALTLSSCSLVEKYLPDAENKPEEAPKESRTTITLDEWIEAMNTTNFSYIQTIWFSDYTPYIDSTTTFRFDGTTLMAKCEFIEDDETEIFYTYYTKIDDVLYTIEEDRGIYKAEIADAELVIPTALKGFLGAGEDLVTRFEDLVYDEETKCYTHTATDNSTYNNFHELSFADGKITSVRASFRSSQFSYDTTYFDFGTTEITLPDFTLPEDEVRTTVTLEEWLKAMKIDNYTRSVEFYGRDGDGSQVHDSSLFEIFDGTDGYRKQEVTGGDPQFAYTTTIDGVQYDIFMEGADWVAIPTMYPFAITLGYAFGGDDDERSSVYELLIYDSETETYKYEFHLDGITISYEIGFENGEITKFDIVEVYDNGIIIYFVCTNFGENDVTLPDFTFAE